MCEQPDDQGSELFSPYPRGRLAKDSSVLAVVPHYRCEPWLATCLESLVTQTRPLDGIVVIDDGSGDPPTEIVEQFPQVTLLASEENVGPYHLMQAVINTTAYDAYLFQDADDWSAPNRLEILLAEAERSGAELVGCQGIRIVCDEGEALTYTEPLDVNVALAMRPFSIPLHHPTSLVARDLVVRLGGFATGLRYGGDTEFLRRAAHVARVVNVPQFCYYYRNRPGSLTSDPETGLRSPARRDLWAIQRERAHLNASLVASGQPPLLEPMAVAPPIALTHLTGPTLAGATDDANAAAADRRQDCAEVKPRPPVPVPQRSQPGQHAENGMQPATRPIFVIGSLRSGASLLAWSLGQHPNILALLDNSWLEPFAGSLEETYAAAVRSRAVSQLDIMGIEIEDFYEHFGVAINRLLLSGGKLGGADSTRGDGAMPAWDMPTASSAARWLDASPTNAFNVVGLRRLFPATKFIHVLRDAPEVIEALTSEEKRSIYRSHWRKYTEEAAYEHWLETVQACVAAERAYGSTTVLRVCRDDLMENPEATLCRCLNFLGEPFEPPCMRPFA